MLNPQIKIIGKSNTMNKFLKVITIIILLAGMITSDAMSTMVRI